MAHLDLFLNMVFKDYMSFFIAKFIEKQIERERVRKGEQVRICSAIFPSIDQSLYFLILSKNVKE